jgi:hypothetical protein
MTLSAGSSTITIGNGNNAQTFAGGGLTYGTLTTGINGPAATNPITITGTNTFGTLTLISELAGNGGILSGFALSASQTVTGTFTSNNGGNGQRAFIYSSTVGTQVTITAATVAATFTDFRDIKGSGAGSWNFSSLTSNANGDCGGNSGITFTTPKNCYLKAGASNINWSAGPWETTSGGGTPIVPAYPLPQDQAYADANAFSATGKTLTMDMIRIPGVSFVGVTNTPAFVTGSTAFECYGEMVLVSGMTHTGAGTCSFMGRSTYSLDGGTLTWPTSSTIIMNAPGGTLSLAENLTSNAGLQTNNGTFALNGYSFTGTAIAPQGGTISGTGAITGTTYTQTGGTVTLGGTLTLTGAAAISGGTLDLNGHNETGATTLAVSGTGTLDLSGQFKCSSTITVSAGTVNNTGASGELKTTGNSAITFSGGTSTVMKITEGGTSNIVVSGTGSLTIPAGGSMSWTTGLFEVSGATALFTTGGPVLGTDSTLTVGAGGSFTFG